MKTLFVSDLDGTLLNKNASLTNRTADILNSLTNSGLNFTFATARTASSAVAITSKLNIHLPCILMNGVSIYDISKDRYIRNEYISPDSTRKISKIFERHTLYPFMYRIEKNMLSAVYSGFSNGAMREFYEIRKKKYDKPFVKCRDLREYSGSSVVYFTILDSYERLLPVKNEIERTDGVKYAFYKDVYHVNWFLEIFSCNASKYNAVMFLKDYGGFDSVTGFGDNLNDIPLFEACDRKIAVENARNELKTMADCIIGNNDSDAVAEWIMENFVRKDFDK